MRARAGGLRAGGGGVLRPGRVGHGIPDHLHAAALVLFVGLYLLLADRGRSCGGRAARAQPWARAVAMIALGGCCCSVLWAAADCAGRAEVEGLREPGRVTFSTDLLAFVSPSPFGVLGDAAPDYARAAIGGNATEGAAYLGGGGGAGRGGRPDAPPRGLAGPGPGCDDLLAGAAAEVALITRFCCASRTSRRTSRCPGPSSQDLPVIEASARRGASTLRRGWR